jgi:transposase
MKRLTAEQKKTVIFHLQQHKSVNQVSSITNIGRTSIQRIAKDSGITLQSKSPGRPSILSQKTQRHIVHKVQTGQLDTAVEAQKLITPITERSVSVKTVRRCLRRAGLRGALEVKKPFLSQHHQKAHAEFARAHKNWSVVDWKKVIWSDESKINCSGSDGRSWCWKTKGKKQIESRTIQGTIKGHGGSIMVWGSMTSKGPGYLAKINGGLDSDLYCQILKDDLVKTIEYYSMDKSEVILQHDNDPKHTSTKAKKCLHEELQLTLLPWPSQSPDLNPIEHLWKELKKRLAGYETQAKSLAELWERIQLEWEKFTEDDCNKLIESMPSRIRAVLRAKGGHTKY